MLFPEGSYQLSASSREAVNPYVARLQNLQSAKVVVYGYTDNLPVGAPMKRASIASNIDLSSRRADNVVAYLTLQGVSPNMISAKGFGDVHPVAPQRHASRSGAKTGASRACWRAQAPEVGSVGNLRRVLPQS